MGQLVKHRHKTVDEVIKESVSSYLELSTFNNTTEVAHLLEKLGIDVAQVRELFPSLDEMMRRRHQIVHRADRVKVADSDHYELAPIDAATAHAWLETTGKFFLFVVSGMAARSVIQLLQTKNKQQSTSS